MITIGFINRKGGSGKTTICISLAIAAANGGEKKVVVIDCDASLDSASDFFEIRGKDDVIVETLTGRDLYKLAEAYHDKGFDFCFVDIGGWDAKDTRIAALFCGTLIVPVVPSGNFYRGADKTIGTLKEIATQGKLEAKPRLLITKCRRNTITLRIMRKAIEDFGYPVFETVLYERADYSNADLESKSVTEYKSCQAGGEIRRLLAEINELE